MARTHTEIEKEIVAALDVAAEYAALGVRLDGNRPGADGFLACYSYGRDDDRNASAQINVQTGRYNDFTSGGESNLSLWDFAAEKAKRFKDWREARKYYAEKAGVELPKKSKKKTADAHIEWRPWNYDLVAIWCLTKPPITPEAVKANGGRLGVYYGRFPVVALPFFPDGRLGEPCGWVIWHAGGLMLPVFDEKGEVKKWAKMKSTFNSERGYIGQYALERIANAERIWKTEGPGDMLAGWSILSPELRETHLFISNSGGSNEYPQGPALDTLFGSKRVGVVHDADVPGQNGAVGSVERNKLGWAGAIARSAAECRNVLLPYPVAPKHGKDLRDFFAEGHTYGELLGLYESSSKAEPAHTTSREAPDDPHRLARLFLHSKHGSVDGVPILRFWRGEWYRWDRGSYRTIDDDDLSAELTSTIKEEFDRLNLIEQAESEGEPVETRKVTGRLVSDCRLALVGMCLLGGGKQAPFWIGEPGPWPAEEIFATENKLVHIPSLIDPEASDVAEKTTPLFFTPNGTDYKFSESPPEPKRWLDFLNSVWPNDEEAIHVLQQWFGYCLLPNTHHHKIMYLIGPKRSGKGTIARVLEHLVGRRNVCNPTLSTLGDRFGLWSLVDRTLAVLGDVRISQRYDTAQVVENLLNLSGEDGKDIDRKNLPMLKNVRLKTRFMILSNEDPDLRDASGAILSRLIVLKMSQSFYKKEDKQLLQKLLPELPGILLWAAAGYRDLEKREQFVEPESSQKAVRELERSISPIKAFIDDCLIVKPGYTAPCSAVYERFKEWCREENGIERAPSQNKMARDLRTLIDFLDVARPAGVGFRERQYVGIAIKAEGSMSPVIT